MRNREKEEERENYVQCFISISEGKISPEEELWVRVLIDGDEEKELY